MDTHSLPSRPLPHEMVWCACVHQLWQRNVIVACVLLVAILHIIRQSTNLIGHSKILAWPDPSVGEWLAHETSCVAPYSMLLTSAQVPLIRGCSHLDKSKVPPLAETGYIYILIYWSAGYEY